MNVSRVALLGFAGLVVVSVVSGPTSAGIIAPCASQHLTIGDLVLDIRGNEGSQPTGGTDQTKCMNGISSLTHVLLPSANAVSANRALLDAEHILSAVSTGSDFSKTGNFGTFFTPRFGAFSTVRATAEQVTLHRNAFDERWNAAYSDTFTVSAPNRIDFASTITPMDATKFTNPYGTWMMRFQANYTAAMLDRAIWFVGKLGPAGAEQWIRGNAPDDPGLVYGGSYRHELSPVLAFDPANVAPYNLAAYDWPRYTKPYFIVPLASGQMLQVIFDRTYSPVDEIRWPEMKWFKGKLATDYTYIVRHPVSGRTYGYRGRLLLEPSFDFGVAAANAAAYHADIAGTSWP